MINWKVRIANKAFWIAFIPAVILLIQAVASALGFNLDLNEVSTKILAIVEAVFAVLTILGVVTDPTTKGISDSERAMTYTKPN